VPKIACVAAFYVEISSAACHPCAGEPALQSQEAIWAWAGRAEAWVGAWVKAMGLGVGVVEALAATSAEASDGERPCPQLGLGKGCGTLHYNGGSSSSAKASLN